MFCEYCGNKIENLHKFCTKCGRVVSREEEKAVVIQEKIKPLNEKWWHRLLRVLYIILYLPLLIIIPIVWSLNSSSYSSYYSTQVDTSGLALWYSILTLLIYLVVGRLIKLAVLYIAMGKEPQWKQEFKKIF